MSAVIGALRGVLSMDSAAFETGAKRAKATMGTVERRMVRLAGHMERAGRRMALGLTLPMAGAAAVAIRSSLQIVDAQAKMAQSLGTTVASMQVLERAADLSGVSMGEMQQATLQLTKRLSQAAGGSGAAAKALGRLKLSAAELQALPLDQRLSKIQSALADYVPEAERAAVASDLFGSRAGLIFTRVDGAALRTAAQDVSRFGVAISEVDADQIELTNDALSRMSLAGRGLANQVTVALAPALQSLSDRAADLASWFNGLSDGTKRIIATTGLIAGAAGPAALALGLMLKISAPLAVAMGAVVSTVALAPLRFAAAAKSAIALEIALGATSTKAAVASLAIKGLQRGLVLLRGAVIATGIGALVVGAGYLAMKFHQLVVATGGWGAALRALGSLAVGVWEGIKTSAAAIKPSLAAIWSQVQAGFTRMLQDLSLHWGNFLWTLSQGMRGLPGLSEVQQSLRNASDQAIDKVMELDLAASSLEGRVIRLRKEAAGQLTAGFEKAGAAMRTLSGQMNSANDAIEAGDDSADALANTLNTLDDTLDDGSGGGVAGSLQTTTEAAGDLSSELEGPLSTAVDGVARSFGDWIADGLRDFRSMWDGIKQAAKRGLADLAASFAKNQIRIALGLSLTGAGSAAQAAGGLLGGGLFGGGAGGGGGLLSGLLGKGLGGLFGGGGALGGIASGLGGVFSGGGLGSSFANLGGLLSGSVGGFGALGAALPAVGIVLGGVALLKKAFGRKYKHSGIRGSFGATGFEGSAFDFYKGGWFRSNKTKYRGLDPELDRALDLQFGSLRDHLEDMGGSLGLSIEALKDFRGASFEIITNGKSQEDIQRELAAQMENASDQMAELLLGTEDFAKIGESATQTLSRLSGSLTRVNDAMDLLGRAEFDVSLEGADLASDLLEAFGGSDAFSVAISSYFSGFYTEAERSEVLMRRLQEEFEALGIAMPSSRDGFRALVESLDLTTEGGQALYADLLRLSGALGDVLPKVGAFTAELAGLAQEIGGEIGVQIEAAQQMVTEARDAAQAWRRTAESLRGFVADLVNTELTAASGGQTEAILRARMDAAFAKVQAGDMAAAADLPELARAFLRRARETASTELDYRRIAAEVQGRLAFAAGIAELEAGNDEVLAGLYEQQIELLTSLGTFLQLESLTGDQVAELSEGVQELAQDWDGTVAAFESALAALQDAIESAEAFSYEDLVGALDVAVTLDDSAPDWLRALVEQADTGIRTTLDFIIRRDDLTAADRWIATHALSQHVATLDLVLGSDLDEATRTLALTTAADLRRSLRLDLAQDLDPDTRALVLTKSANLSRRINVALTGEGADTVAQLTEIANLIGSGEGSGRLTFGGGVVLEADDVFADLVDSTGELVEPMERLRGMLAELRDAVDADRAAREAEQQLAKLQAQGRGLALGLEDRSEASGLIAQIAALEQRTGVSLRRSGNRDAELHVDPETGRIQYDADWVSYGSGADLAGWKKAFWADGGLEDQIAAYNKRHAKSSKALEQLRAQVRDLGGIPAFARGGAHRGGARIVGERGWEIETTGPSRIHSHAESVAMLDNRPLTKGVEELTRHVVAQGQVVRMLVDRIATHLDGWDEVGLPGERS
ncbi:hypothetical protein J3366_02995 [Tritonibacter mobilis]|uniref:hypothetical protein n=1 Tax=Tritonibacter mobilis TaxID=379347 RepID=UPI003BAD5702